MFLIARPATIQKAIYRTLKEVENPLEVTGISPSLDGSAKDLAYRLREPARRRLAVLRELLR